MQPILLIESNAPGLLYVNGQFCGELTEPQAFPSWPDARALIEYRPLGRAYWPMACALTLRDGQVQPHGQEGVFCVQWPEGIAQVELRPQSLGGQTKREELGAGVSLLMQDGNAALARNDEILQPLPQGAKELGVRQLEDGGCVVSGRCPGGLFVCAVPPEGGAIAGDAQAFVLARTLKWERKDLLQAVTGSEDTVGHGVLNEYRVDAGGLHRISSQPVWADGAPRWPQNGQETLRAYLEAVHAGHNAEAEGYLASPDLQPALPRFDAVLPLRYPLNRLPAGLPLAMGVMAVEEAGLARVTAVCARAKEARGRQGNYRLEALAILN